MEKFNELLNILLSLKITQKSGDWIEDLPNDIWKYYIKDNFKVVKAGLNVDTHRWYETSVDVIEIFGGFIGIRYITNMFSESQDYEDCYATIEFMQMTPILETTYVTI